MDSKKETIDIIKSLLCELSASEREVRNYINTTRYQNKLIKNLSKWNQICSSLDVIGDTVYSINDYIISEFPHQDGLKYIFIYGILQSLFLQQDAIRHLHEAFEIEFDLTPSLKNIRFIRNASIGHPTKHFLNKLNYYNYISRITMSKFGFTLIRSGEDGFEEFIDVDLFSLIHEQLTELQQIYAEIASKLKEYDIMHKEKYSDRLLAELFHPSMHYLFSKVSEGIHSASRGYEREFGLSILILIEEKYLKFIDEMKERSEFNEYIEFNLDEYMHAINILKSYLSENKKDLTEADARIYHFYLTENHDLFEKHAKSIDEEYRVDEKIS